MIIITRHTRRTDTTDAPPTLSPTDPAHTLSSPRLSGQSLRGRARVRSLMPAVIASGFAVLLDALGCDGALPGTPNQHASLGAAHELAC